MNEVYDGSSKGNLFLDSSEKRFFFKVPAVTPLYLPERIFGGGGVDGTSDCSADVCRFGHCAFLCMEAVIVRHADHN